IASENLDHILTFPRREACHAILQRLLFRYGPTQFLEFFKKLVGFDNTERLRNGTTIEYIEPSFAGVTMTVGNAAKFCVADFCCATKGPVNDGATHLQRAQIGLRKSMTGKINRCDRELLVIERREIFS